LFGALWARREKPARYLRKTPLFEKSGTKNFRELRALERLGGFEDSIGGHWFDRPIAA
jgi:hypothetical protein